MVCQDIWDGVGVSDVLERSGRSLEAVTSGARGTGGDILHRWLRLAPWVAFSPRPKVLGATTGVKAPDDATTTRPLVPGQDSPTDRALLLQIILPRPPDEETHPDQKRQEHAVRAD